MYRDEDSAADNLSEPGLGTYSLTHGYLAVHRKQYIIQKQSKQSNI